MRFEVDTWELRRRVRRASGNPFLRGMRYQRVELFPQDQRWWAGRQRRRAWIYLDELDFDGTCYVQQLNPLAYQRFVQLLRDLLDVEQIEIQPLSQASRGLFTLAPASPPLLHRHQVAQSVEGRLVDQLGGP